MPEPESTIIGPHNVLSHIGSDPGFSVALQDKEGTFIDAMMNCQCVFLLQKKIHVLNQIQHELSSVLASERNFFSETPFINNPSGVGCGKFWKKNSKLFIQFLRKRKNAASLQFEMLFNSIGTNLIS